ncbi:hypothetical protein [Scytonema sp. NUACC26]
MINLQFFTLMYQTSDFNEVKDIDGEPPRYNIISLANSRMGRCWQTT